MTKKFGRLEIMGGILPDRDTSIELYDIGERELRELLFWFAS